MKGLRFCTAVLMAMGLGLLLATMVSAQDGVTITPAQLSVAGTRGAVETRTLLIRAGEPLTGLKAIPLDLQGVERDAVLPAGVVRASLPADDVAAGELLTVPVTVDLRGAPGGEFRGELLLKHQTGVVTVPTTVTVKHRWPLAFFVLLAGVVLGLGVSVYRAAGRPRDQVLVRVGQLRAQMREGEEVAEPFQDRIASHLLDVETALQAETWEEARQAMERAETTWAKWRRDRDDWLAQIAYQGELMKRLEDEPDVPHIQALRRKLKDEVRDAPGRESPDELRQRLDDLAAQINDYLQLRHQLDQLNELRNQLPSGEQESWRAEAQELEYLLNNLTPGDEQAYKELKGKIDGALVDLSQAVESREAVDFTVRKVLGPAAALRLLGPAPATREVTEKEVEGARSRLWWFKGVGYGVAVVLLAGAGFGELYVANATFGASPWSDYFALLVWGFGAEATRAAVTEMVRSWGLPGLEQTG